MEVKYIKQNLELFDIPYDCIAVVLNNEVLSGYY